MRAVVFTGAGGNEVIELQERPDPQPLGEEVVVAVRWAGLNPADAHQRDGHYPAPAGAPQDIPGLEVAGVVHAVGSRVLGWRPGDRVLGLVAGGGLAERVVIHDRHLVRMPEELDERDAAAVPEAFLTAHDAVRTQGGLTMGETLLVHGAAGGVGSAAVQIGLAAGARVLGTVRSERGTELVRSLGAEPIDDQDFAETVLERTHGRGADVILELVGAVHFPANVDALARLGRIVVIGVGAGRDAQLPLMSMMRKRATLKASTLRARSLEDKALALRAFERELSPQFAAKRLRPLIDAVYPVEQVREAFERLEGPGKAGKILIAF